MGESHADTKPVSPVGKVLSPRTRDISSFKGFCFLSREYRYQRLFRLSQLAPEPWEYTNSETDEALPILSRYVDFTFRRIKEQNRIACSPDGNWACFHTGLLTPLYRPIYGLFQKSQKGKEPWYLKRFTTDEDSDLKHFAELPKRATYFENPADLIYDTSFRLVLTDHSLIDRAHRFPPSFQGVGEEIEAKRWRAFNEAAKHAEFRVEQSYKTAVPQYYWPGPGKPGVLQLLLPICMETSTQADFALPIQRDGQTYRAYTVLELDWAYGNARLIAKPDSEWLQPQKWPPVPNSDVPTGEVI
ncbi:hypothetical protein Snoj_04190 [Streptomyces nojiriensis]|uniref:DUF3825 domain-containing protein n=1 Tax=Streptomyces nojiriensis TaxID=66374 RepID=A0ABQ3SED7_9ACTN|nr:DUF3825 domain-containing protein [Streptomyces nojiriensis]QTI48152.1 hypothetical protein JYK04_06012 [Streptomyces nojiriensis]GGS25733.1 hypothetical protein GCM10010205_64660 [Streptomyces nojiriensis]GHI66501.1 hypothetical protein Snoj_04190 [Streptomyces nojiriensis]